MVTKHLRITPQRYSNAFVLIEDYQQIKQAKPKFKEGEELRFFSEISLLIYKSVVTPLLLKNQRSPYITAEKHLHLL